MTLTELFKNIADAIREKKGTTEPIVAEDFPEEIESIESGGNLDDYFNTEIGSGNSARPGAIGVIKSIPNTTIVNGTSLAYSFYNFIGLTAIPLIDTSNVTNMQSMFSNCYNFTTIPLLDTSNVTNMQTMFNWCNSLEEIPLLNTSNVKDIAQMFSNCLSLTTVPLLNTSKVTSFYNTFNNCTSLNNESLNNILMMCVNSAVTSNKTLAYIGISSSQATICQGLSNYQAFLDAGWTTGY